MLDPTDQTLVHHIIEVNLHSPEAEHRSTRILGHRQWTLFTVENHVHVLVVDLAKQRLDLEVFRLIVDHDHAVAPKVDQHDQIVVRISLEVPKLRKMMSEDPAVLNQDIQANQ